MKNYIYICLLSLIGYQVQAQSYNYTDLGILFSTDNNTGTARATALNGSLGAVGGDLSSININPAGIAVFNNGEVSATLGSYNFNNSTNYYNNSLDNSSTTFNLNQVGAVFVFKDAITTNDWSKVSFAVNYQKTANYHTRNAFFGNSGFASFIKHPNHPDYNEDPDLDNSPDFDNAVSQDFYNYIDGTASKINLALAGQYGNNFYAGFSLNIHHINFSQSTTLNELSEDNNGNTLDVLATEDLTESADGFSINLGFIYKPIQSVRLGLAYQSPTWYNFTEDFSDYISIYSEGIGEHTNSSTSYLDYKYRTPGKITASGALVIGKSGFINIDYTAKLYNSLNLSGSSNFRNDNQYYNDVLNISETIFVNNISSPKITNNVNIGGEFRLQNLSLRGGFGYQQSPFKSNLDPRDTDILKLGDQYSGSLGAGIRFGPSRLDIAYRRTVQDNEYDFNDLNQQFQYIESAKTNNKNSRVVATYTYSF